MASPVHEALLVSSRTSQLPPQRRMVRTEQDALRKVLDWFTAHNWTPFRFQRRAWSACLDGKSGLIHAGTGKTYAAWMGPLIQWMAQRRDEPGKRKRSDEPLRVLWVTPLRALAADTMQTLESPLRDLQIPWTLESRTGDTSSTVRNRQSKRLPTALVTTPESLSLLLGRNDAAQQFAHLQTVIVDEWHELLSTKRGVQTELCLARLRRWRPNLQTWGLSATLGNTEHAMKVLLGNPGRGAIQTASASTAEQAVESHQHGSGTSPVRCPSLDVRAGATGSASVLQTCFEPNDAGTSSGTPIPRIDPAQLYRIQQKLSSGILIQGAQRKRVIVDSVIPKSLERFPWAGHLGLRLVDDVVSAVDEAETSLVFTNTRSQTEAWYQALLKLRPDWAGKIALHHGSLDRDKREWVEEQLRQGQLKCVVCTSTLDLGVDFAPVQRVFQIGSPKGVARLLQRAGRSGHQPGQDSRVTFVPAHALELLEVAAAKDAIESDILECRVPPVLPLDLLAQHATTMSLGEGFLPDDLFNEVRTTTTYANLARNDFDWTVNFISTGGDALRAYPEYHKVRLGDDGRYHLDDRRMALQHRLSIGTIVSDASLTVQYMKGPKLGTIEEGFLARLKPGDCFIFAGHPVELVQVRDSKAWVRKAKSSRDIRMPRWMGGRMPLSTELAKSVRGRLAEAAQGEFRGPEMRALRPLLELQARWSRIPKRGELLIERAKSRDGHHLYIYPFAGRLVHEGIGALLAYRMSRRTPITFGISVNDYGFELLSPVPAPFDELLQNGLFETSTLGCDISECMNAAEMAKRQFREVASIAGLVFKGFPGKRKSAGQMQASSGLLFDVFSNYDPGNLLLRQTRGEVLESQLEHSRLMQTLHEMTNSRLLIQELSRFSPLSFPLLVERMRERLSSEKLADRIRRMQESLEAAADK
jgi:ATP-dependent Lhr-like helicase